MNTGWKDLIRYRTKIFGAAITVSALFLHNTSYFYKDTYGLNDVFQHQASKCFSLKKPSSLLNFTTSTYLYSASCKEHSSNEFIADAAELAMSAVVSIEVSRHTDFFGMNQEGTGSGSGFVVDSSLGHIITNEHVVAGAKNVTVVLRNGSQLQGSVLAIDGKTDLALIKVNTSLDLPQILMGDESKLRPGQWVVAIGNSLQFPNTVTAGIVSGVARNLQDHKLFSRGMGNANQLNKIANSTFVQTDTTINPGNSGGPLVNLDGEVIAVNTLTLFGVARGISFSIPISEVKRFLHDVSRKQHPPDSTKLNFVLGIRMISLSHEMIKFLHHNGRLDPSVHGGVFVHDIYKDSPASEAKLIKGDVIVTINNSEVYCRDDLRKVLEKSNGNPVSITFFRPFHGFLKVKIKPVSVNEKID